MINFSTENGTMNLITEAPTVSACLAAGAVLAVGLIMYLEKRKS